MCSERVIHRLLLIGCGAFVGLAAWAGRTPADAATPAAVSPSGTDVPSTAPAVETLAASETRTLKTAHPADTIEAPVPTETKVDDEKEILILQALDDPNTTLKVVDSPITEAIRQLSENTGIPITFERGTLGFLPYGSKTTVTATIEKQPLRESLAALLQPLALKYVLTGDKLLIAPRPALARICRRATWDEIGTIQELYANPWTKELADSLQFQFLDMSTTDSEANRKRLYELAESVGTGSAARVLELACVQYGWEWYPDGKHLVICTKTRQIERQLDQPVCVQYNEVQLKEVLLDLAQRAHVLLKMEPGALSSLPTYQAERYRLTLENTPIRQAFELIAGETGLSYFIEADGVRIAGVEQPAGLSTGQTGTADSNATAAATVQALRSNPIIGEITLPGPDGTTYSFFLREQDIPPEVNELRQMRIRQAAEQIRSVLMATRPSE